MGQLPLVDRPGGAALFFRPAGPVTSAAFLGDVLALAARLPDGPVLNLCRDRYLFAVGFAAALLRGGPSLLPGDPSPEALAGLAAAYGPAVTLADDVCPASPCPVVIVPTGSGEARGPSPAVPADRLAAIVFTSGSTGVPIAHRKSWGALVARSRAAGERFGFDEAAPASVVGTVPPGHMYGFETTALLPLHAASASWCGQAFFPADVEAALRSVPAPRILVTTPLQMRALAGIDASGLRAVISATAPLDPALAADTEARWDVPVLEIFGATECGSIASRRTLDGDPWLPYPGVDVRVGAEAASVSADGIGPVALADELDLLPDGRFKLLGRRADMVKLGGRRASLAGLNRILTGLSGVRDGIFVVPDDLDRRSTARLFALVVAPERSARSIVAELRGRLDPIFLPRRVVHVDALPRNPLGKLPRQAVLELLAQAGAR